MIKVYLIGMPGSGKTTVGLALALALELPFVDLDVEIERKEGRSVSEIFASEGEEHFRRLESAVLKDYAESDQEFVMATGGGAPCFLNGIDRINRTGFSFFLDVPVEIILSRLEKEQHRPLLQASDRLTRLKELSQQRHPIYSQAHYIIRNLSDPVAEIVQLVRLSKD